MPLFLMSTLFWGCDQVQQLLTPLPDGDEDSAIKIGFLHTSPDRNNSRYGAELATLQLNKEGGVRGRSIQLIPRGIPTQRFISENINDIEYVTALAEELIAEEQYRQSSVPTAHATPWSSGNSRNATGYR